ncbi:MAG: T9SS type A sorting domain-containing protein [Bacteroidales bacterium]|nr:T9SS type A sorting domain-containing protein [Bacteroidales bacterium]
MKNLLFITSLLLIISVASAQTVTDIDGNEYNIVNFGSQAWMKENLRVTHYQNGDLIPNITNQTAWGSLMTGGRCYYDNDSALNSQDYGALYNWWAVIDNRNICPEGWHVPTDYEWHTLIKTIDPNAQFILGTESYTAGGEMKEADTAHWHNPNVGATNNSGFTALPGGSRDAWTYGYLGIGEICYFWSSSPAFMGDPWYRSLYREDPYVARWGRKEYFGQSVRCVRDSLNIRIDENNSGDRLMFKVFPNPATEMIYIKTSINHKLIIEILDISGKCILSDNIFSKEMIIDISILNKGLYIVKLSGNGKIGFTKLLKE